MSRMKKMIVAALLVAAGIALPMALHSIPNGGKLFLPMHIPVLLCGLLCGWPHGLACGILAPLLSSLFTGMPPAAALPGMVCELAVYGTASALLVRFVPIRPLAGRVYASLAGAMLAGRLVAGASNALLFSVGTYSLRAWVAASFVTALPGIAIQLVLIPAVVLALHRARLLGNEEHPFG